MSFRAFGNRLWNHGTLFVRRYRDNSFATRKISHFVKCTGPSLTHQQVSVAKNVQNNRHILRNICIQISQQARRILIKNHIAYSPNNKAAEWIQKIKTRGLYGHTAPLLGLIGLVITGNEDSIFSKCEEQERVCCDIRECIRKTGFYQKMQMKIENSNLYPTTLNLDCFTFGKAIAKGSNAVVYSVNLKKSENIENEQHILKLNNTTNLALKMMFNYDIQSNSIAILKAMYREIVPASTAVLHFNQSQYYCDDYQFLQAKRHLPPHPNIIEILSVFSDSVPQLDDCFELYPAALPKRIDPNGEGRNMSLFILMKRYEKNLNEFLLHNNNLSLRTSVIILTQILEGIVHMVSNNVAHRDLKTDNILLDLTNGDKSPLAVISDFGCCLTEGLQIPYITNDTDKGGNISLMAPEIITKRPGTFVKLDYSKSDLWACGTIAYEIFGEPNPFYSCRNKTGLSNRNYTEENLPDLDSNRVPLLFDRLIKNMLNRDPRKRLSPEMVANVCQLFLWAPKLWLTKQDNLSNKEYTVPSEAEILEWLMNLTVKILCEDANNKNNNLKFNFIPYTEYLLISTFLSRAKLLNIRAALNWIQNNA